MALSLCLLTLAVSLTLLASVKCFDKSSAITEMAVLRCTSRISLSSGGSVLNALFLSNL